MKTTTNNKFKNERIVEYIVCFLIMAIFVLIIMALFTAYMYKLLVLTSKTPITNPDLIRISGFCDNVWYIFHIIMYIVLAISLVCFIVGETMFITQNHKINKHRLTQNEYRRAKKLRCLSKKVAFLPIYILKQLF